MRYFLFSGIVHLALVIAGLFFISDTLDFQKVGDPSVSFTMVGESVYASGSSSSPLNKSSIDEIQKKKPKQENFEKKVKKQKKEVVEDIKEVIKKPIEVEEVVEVPNKELVEEIIEEPIETKDISEIVEESSKNIEPTVTEPTENISDDKSVSKDISQSSNNGDTSKALGDGLVHLDDGSIAAKNQGVKGLEYGFLSQPEPSYPDIAKRMGVDDEIVIKVRFLIGYDGRVEDIKYYDNITNFGFRSEVEKALSSWKATPITVDGKPVKLYFYKSFKFEKL